MLKNRKINLSKKLTITLTVIAITLLIAVFSYLYTPSRSTQFELKWSKTFGGEKNEQAWYVSSTKDKGCLVLGYTESYGSGNKDIWLLKIDENGKKIWSQTYGGKGEDYAKSILETDDGYLIIGFTDSYSLSEGENNVIVIKIDVNGKELWNKTYGGLLPDEGYSIIQTTDGYFIISGYTMSYGFENSEDLWVIKIKDNGEELWNKTYGGAGSEYGRSIIETNDGYLVAGETNSYSSDKRFSAWLLKINKTGHEMWNFTYDGLEYDDYFNQILENDNGFIMVGQTANKTKIDSEEKYYTNGYIVIVDKNGTLVSERIIKEGEETGLSSIAKSDDGYLITGYIGAYGTGEGDILVEKINNMGNRVWMKIYGGCYGDAGIWVDKGVDSNYFIAGYTDLKGRGFTDIWVMRLQLD